jgi:dolichol-phosphate mannosyltransferase
MRVVMESNGSRHHGTRCRGFATGTAVLRNLRWPLPTRCVKLRAVTATAGSASRAMASDLELSIVVPTFNESANVRDLLEHLRAVLGETGWEVVFVDDDSPDDTAALVRSIARSDPRVRCVQRVGRRGLSSACIEGMLASAAPCIAVMDADLQHDASILPKMLELLRADRADLVIGTRYAQGGSTGDWDRHRASLSRFATRASRLVVRQPVSDPMSGYFMLRRDVLDTSVRRLSALGFKILLDILASAPRTLRVAEVPFTFHQRHGGESKLDELVIWEFGMLLADKTIGRYVPVRFIAFALVGGLGVFVHMAVLTVLIKLLGVDFRLAQSSAAGVAMVFNFALNNVLTYRDRRLTGWAWWRGLASFVAACSVGALANVGIATYLFESRTAWFLAALAGVLVGAVWNYAVTRLYTWGRRGAPAGA